MKELEYKVTARKWRPLRFSEVTSQEFITTTLKNSIKSKRVSHAYLFSGPRGVGKTTVARILAKSINCLKPGEDGEPCNECNSCTEINNDNRNHPDVFEIDGASNRNIEDVRELKEKVKYGPIRSKYKVFIIDEVHMLTGASFNALLKTLEEPPEYIVFIFATTAPEKVPLTILGRCQKFDFKRLTADEIILRLRFITEKENIKIDDESLFFIAKKGDGSMRDAQGLLDIATAYCGDNITFEQLKSFFNLAESDIYFRITEHIKNKNGHQLLTYLDELINAGYDLQMLLEGLQGHIRNLLIVKSTGSTELLMEAESVKKKYKEFAEKLSEIELINSLKLIIQTEYTFKYSSNQRILLEVLLMELIKFTDTRDISAIAEELQSLKKKNETETLTSEKEARELKTADRNKDDFQKENYQELKQVQYYNESKAQEENSGILKKVQSDNEEGLQSGNSLTKHWEIIKEQIMNEKKWVYSLIKNFSINGDKEGEYNIKLEPGQYDMIIGYEGYLASKIIEYFGKDTKFELIRCEKPSATEENNFNKICQILINEFNGKVI